LTGALLGEFLFDLTADTLSPMNVNFGLLPELDPPVRGKRERKLAKAAMAKKALTSWLRREPVSRLLADAGG
jgi:methylenetetrahydrofolate--tRNA-(uracil-5-)-methyltransferase